jgi:hypothetical protein
MYRGARYRMVANDFAVPRMDPGKQRPIQSMEEARQWERLFIGEIQAARDPRRPFVHKWWRFGTHNVWPTIFLFLRRCR